MKEYALATSVTGKEIKVCRQRLKQTQAEFARFANVTKKTVERWEGSDSPITGPIVTLVKILNENVQMPEMLSIPAREYALRLWYMHRDQICSVIDVDEAERKVRVWNYTKYPLLRAFGIAESPTYAQYEAFLESRCFPRERDKMKLMLRELDLPFYDPLLIIEKTEGRMAEDAFWIRIERC